MCYFRPADTLFASPRCQIYVRRSSMHVRTRRPRQCNDALGNLQQWPELTWARLNRAGVMQATNDKDWRLVFHVFSNTGRLCCCRLAQLHMQAQPHHCTCIMPYSAHIGEPLPDDLQQCNADQASMQEPHTMSESLMQDGSATAACLRSLSSATARSCTTSVASSQILVLNQRSALHLLDAAMAASTMRRPRVSIMSSST